MSTPTLQAIKATRVRLSRPVARLKMPTRSISSNLQKIAGPSVPGPIIIQATNNSLHSSFQTSIDAKHFSGDQEGRRSESNLFSSVAVEVDSDDAEDNESTEHDILDGFDMDKLNELASSPLTGLSLSDMHKYGTGADMAQRIRNAQFLHTELQRRLAQRVMDLLSLPHGLSNAAPVCEVARIYVGYLKQFQSCPVPTNVDEELMFTDMLQCMVLDRSKVPETIARAIDEWADVRKEDIEVDRLSQMERALNRFFTARVGLRFLTEHHVLSSPLHKGYPNCQELRMAQSSFNEGDDYQPGCIQTNCDPKKEIIKVAAHVVRQTKEHYGICPEINIIECENTERNFTYVPHHIHYMAAELIKNSCRATVQQYLKKGDENSELPPIRIVVVKGAEDVTIKIADKGGGIPRSRMTRLWKFAHSTADLDENSTDFGKDEATGGRIRGFGLPLARIYARYFGGELTLKTMEGYGVDAYLHLPRLGDESENLPKRVSSSPGYRDSTPSPDARFYSTSARNSVVVGDVHQLIHGDCVDDTLENARLLRVMSILRRRAL